MNIIVNRNSGIISGHGCFCAVSRNLKFCTTEGEGEMRCLAPVARISVVGKRIETSTLAVTLPWLDSNPDQTTSQLDYTTKPQHLQDATAPSNNALQTLNCDYIYWSYQPSHYTGLTLCASSFLSSKPFTGHHPRIALLLIRELLFSDESNFSKLQSFADFIGAGILVRSSLISPEKVRKNMKRSFRSMIKHSYGGGLWDFTGCGLGRSQPRVFGFF